ncbi:MAG: hypothetical protein A3K19_02820 [Lentisphaerae bacterium RIFOXYB12_FULL_65_16]|nr:MAG: hypothetical protein A3K18_19870 [Lentisphaerae bacterium RIFOXYA12_64_32]OGV92284.1 MAG: hypothetical protein A3K19_02820 [Lentisphaerae bacterium RIFOXYB12_FULL_65_16]
MDTVFGQRLRQARIMRRLSLRALADATGGKVSHNALARYERGEMSPGSPILLAVAEALGQSTDFFFRPFTVQLGEVRFRKKARLTGGKAEAAREQAADFVERFCEAEELAGDVRTFVPPLPDRATLSLPDQAEAAACELREAWDLGNDPIPSVVGLLESKSIKVCELDVGPDLDGFCAATDAGPLVVLGATTNLPRRRMTSTHELAHVVLPLPDDEKLEEAIVRRFAGAFLLPREAFTDAFGKCRNGVGLRELIELKLTFGASIMAIMKRAEQLELVSVAMFERFCRYASQQGWRKPGQGEPGDDCYNGDETPSRFRQLVWRAVAEQQISLSKGAALLKQDLNSFRRDLKEVIA